MKRKKYIVFIAVILIITGFIYGFYDMAYGEEKKQTYPVSVILPFDGAGEWRLMQQGMKQAAKDFGLSVTYIIMPEDASSLDQVTILEREVKNGAMGILLAAEDRGLLKEAVLETAQKIPIVTVESGISDSSIGQISGENYAMGELLGKRIAKDGYSKVAVIRKAVDRTYMQSRMQGLEEGLGENADIVYLAYNNVDSDVEGILKKVFWSSDYDSVVCVDTATLEKCGNYFNEFHPKAILYGIGGSSQITYSVDEGAVAAIVCQNEFTIGYKGAEKLAKMLTKSRKEISQKADYYLITPENLYDEEYQGLLFPIVD